MNNATVQERLEEVKFHANDDEIGFRLAGIFLNYDEKGNDYRYSERWRTKRDQMKDILPFQCYACGATRKLCLHHKTYEHFGDEPPEDLAWLCWPHHMHAHDWHGLSAVAVVVEDVPADVFYQLVDLADRLGYGRNGCWKLLDLLFAHADAHPDLFRKR